MCLLCVYFHTKQGNNQIFSSQIKLLHSTAEMLLKRKHMDIDNDEYIDRCVVKLFWWIEKDQNKQVEQLQLMYFGCNIIMVFFYMCD